ncbi:MAG TPA: NAD(P)H-dependent oxidoreductase [Alphaproteobacteria bacterium]|jgi:putative NADPH-quinone reductase
MARIAVIQGHPDPGGRHLCRALADAYAEGAASRGHEVQRIEVARIDFPWLRTREDFEKGAVPPALAAPQQAMGAADHFVIVYPLWHGTMPAILKAFFEQIFRPGFAMEYGEGGRWPKKRFRGKTARIVVTMGMPALVYRWYFGAHGLKSLERSILRFSGIHPIRESLFGMVEVASDAKRQKWLAGMRRLGAAAR